MGALAISVVDHGGMVTGIIPEFLTGREFMFQRAQEMIVTRDMHERKQLMFERADAFVALPGGIGTLEELVEQMTWAQLGRHKKPILIANIESFWDPLCALLDHMKALQFIRAGLTINLLVADRVARYPAEADRSRACGCGSREGHGARRRRAAVTSPPRSCCPRDRARSVIAGGAARAPSRRRRMCRAWKRLTRLMREAMCAAVGSTGAWRARR